MRGTILGYDTGTGEGVISSANGVRIKFERADWRSPGDPAPGRQVDYDDGDGRAVDVFAVPGASPLSLSGTEPGKQAVTFGVVSLVCAILTFFLGPIGIITVVLAIMFGIKGKNAGRDLPDRTGYYLSVAGLVIAIISLLVAVVALVALISFVSHHLHMMR